MAEKTKGAYRVGIDFNPGGRDDVHRLKLAAAELIDLIAGIPATGAATNDIERCKALAMTAVEDGAMWAVKAATKPEP